MQELREAVSLAEERLDRLTRKPRRGNIPVGIVVTEDDPEDAGVTVVENSLGEALLDVLELAQGALSNIDKAAVFLRKMEQHAKDAPNSETVLMDVGREVAYGRAASLIEAL